ncbi:MAG TPA: MotA/TolQ/ExbB proton channel family protein [Candidatus Acidoferrales bacterium]|nr:MotA/TolQ/ExbB proton channel family protein [Candidatus Acidoferrales bacterium]
MDKETAVYWMLGLTSVAGLAVVFWRAWMLRWSKVAPPRIVEALTACHAPEDVAQLRSACESSPSPLGRLLLFAANHLDWPKSENVSSLETAARREVVRLERGLVVLEIIIGIAPLLGLVGTILGMMTVFSDIGEAGLNNASKLAHGISVILNATLIGLLIAIPALVAWGYFSKKVEVLTVEIETMCDEFIRRQYVEKNADRS